MQHTLRTLARDHREWTLFIFELIVDSGYSLFFRQQTLISTIQFGETNWAYLLEPSRARDSYQLFQKKRRLPRITCPCWAPFIPEREIRITLSRGAERRGYWKGKPVGTISIFTLPLSNVFQTSIMPGMRIRLKNSTEPCMAIGPHLGWTCCTNFWVTSSTKMRVSSDA